MEEYYEIGTIVSTHALKGEVKIYSITDFKEERYKLGNTLYIKKDNKMYPVKVKSYRVHKSCDLVSFQGYQNINDVLPFTKCKIYVKEDDLTPLEENEYYYHELFNCVVYHDEKRIGIVKDVVNYGASDILIIKNDSEKDLMIPFVDEFILDVNTNNKKIQIKVIEGLLHDED